MAAKASNSSSASLEDKFTSDGHSQVLVHDVEKEVVAKDERQGKSPLTSEGLKLDKLERQHSNASQPEAGTSLGDSPEDFLKDRGHTQQDIEKGPGAISTEEPDDANIIWWDGPDDPQNPMNFTKFRKAVTLGLVSALCFVTPLASSMFAPGVPQLMAEFKSTNIELASFVVSIYVLGFAIGPLLFAPLSELYGRLQVYHVCNVLFIIFTIACALATNLNMLIGFRFLAGTFGSAPLVNGGGTIADIFIQEKRGGAMALFAMGPIMGPIFGPVAGGYLSEAMGWRWIFWILAIISGFNAVMSFLFMRETYAPVILGRKTRRLQKESGNSELRSKLDSGISSKDFFLRSIIRPAKMLIFSPIVLSTSIYVGIVYGYLYLLFTTFTVVFQETYHFSSGAVGLTFVGMGVGSILGLGFFAWVSDRMLKSKAKEADALAAASGQQSAGMKAEYRLPPMLPAAFLIPVGLFIYGWTAHNHVHFIVPIMSTALIGIGNIAIFMCISTYLVDAYTLYAASALAANTVIRSIMGAVLPLAGQKMYKTLGLGWGNSLLAFISIATLPVPWVLIKYGEQLRTKYAVKNL